MSFDPVTYGEVVRRIPTITTLAAPESAAPDQGLGTSVGGGAWAAAITGTTRHRVLNIAGRGGLSYLTVYRAAGPGSTTIEVVADGVTVLAKDITFSSPYATVYQIIGQSLSGLSGATFYPYAIACPSPRPLPFNEGVEVWITSGVAGGAVLYLAEGY